MGWPGVRAPPGRPCILSGVAPVSTSSAEATPGEEVESGGSPVVGTADRVPGREPAWLLVLAGLVLATFVVLRFWTRSDLWLDEAQTVTIARYPITKLPGALRQDGSPPLYYFLLHFWMKAFGTSDLAVRSLSGLFGVATLPLAWRMGRVLGGRPGAWALLMLVATSPFAVRYSTENRMYMMIVFLSLVGFFALRSALARPTWPRLAGVAVVSGLLLLSHYWDLYLVAAVVVGLAYGALRAAPAGRPARLWTLVAVLAGFVLFAPWAPSFVYQLHHTGTPWAVAADLADLGSVPGDLAGLSTHVALTLAVVYIALVVLGLFGVSIGRFEVFMDLRVRRVARPLAWVAGATILLALLASELGHSAYSGRYLAVILVPVLALAALGVSTIGDTRARAGVLAAVVGLGVLGSYPNITTNRTQAGMTAAVITAQGRPGDVVAYCPDQLGPALDRLLPGGRFRQIAFPRGNSPAMVDWVDYDAVSRGFQPKAAARALVAEAGPHHLIWLVWSATYPPLEQKCPALLGDLAALRPNFKVVVVPNADRYYEFEELVRLAPGRP